MLTQQNIDHSQTALVEQLMKYGMYCHPTAFEILEVHYHQLDIGNIGNHVIDYMDIKFNLGIETYPTYPHFVSFRQKDMIPIFMHWEHIVNRLLEL